MAEILMKYTPVKNRSLYDRIVFAYADPDAGVDMAGLQDMATYYGSVMGNKPVDAKTLVDTSFAQRR